MNTICIYGYGVKLTDDVVVVKEKGQCSQSHCVLGLGLRALEQKVREECQSLS